MKCARCYSENYVSRYLNIIQPVVVPQEGNVFSLDYQEVALCSTCFQIINRRRTSYVLDQASQERIEVEAGMFAPWEPKKPEEPPRSPLVESLIASLATATEEQRIALRRLLGPLAYPEGEEPTFKGTLTVSPTDGGPRMTIQLNDPVRAAFDGANAVMGSDLKDVHQEGSAAVMFPQPDCSQPPCPPEWSDFGPFGDKIEKGRVDGTIRYTYDPTDNRNSRPQSDYSDPAY